VCLSDRFTNIFPNHGTAERALGVKAEESDRGRFPLNGISTMAASSCHC
jgi:hypothetical protein